MSGCRLVRSFNQKECKSSSPGVHQFLIFLPLSPPFLLLLQFFFHSSYFFPLHLLSPRCVLLLFHWVSSYLGPELCCFFFSGVGSFITAFLLMGCRNISDLTGIGDSAYIVCNSSLVSADLLGCSCCLLLFYF